MQSILFLMHVIRNDDRFKIHYFFIILVNALFSNQRRSLVVHTKTHGVSLSGPRSFVTSVGHLNSNLFHSKT